MRVDRDRCVRREVTPIALPFVEAGSTSFRNTGFKPRLRFKRRRTVMKRIILVASMLLGSLVPQLPAEKTLPEKSLPQLPSTKLIDIHCSGNLCCFWWGDGRFGGCY